MREGRDTPDVPRELEARTYTHEQRDTYASGREVLVEVEVERVSDRAELDRDRRDWACWSQDQQRLAAQKRLAGRAPCSRGGRSVRPDAHACITTGSISKAHVGHTSDRVHQQVLGQAYPLLGLLLHEGAERDGAEERREEHE